MHPHRTRVFYGILCFVVMACSCLAGAAARADSSPDRNAILDHLNAVISWYRDATANGQPGELPSDAIFQQNVRTLAAQAVQLAFQSARAQATLLGESEGSNSGAGGAPQNYAQIEAQVSQHLADDQSQLDALNKKIPAEAGAKRKNALAQRDALAGQIALDKAMLDAIQKMSSFVELNAVGKQGLEGAIDELANSVPEVVAPHGQEVSKKPGETVSPTTAKSSGLIGDLAVLYDQVQSMRTIDRLIRENERVSRTVAALREPLRASIRTIIAQGQENLPQGTAENGGTQPEDFQKLTKQFDQLAAALLPLSQELLVLQESRSNLGQWRTSIATESKHDLIALLFRVFGIAVALAIVWTLSEVWRRLTFRYVHDARRRRQFLVLRRFVMGFFFAMVVTLGFVSEFSSLATYAGFVTAGVAVGLQTLLLSVAAYFFVVGRYGIRIGDRITVAGVTGEVVDVGLVRLYIMELAGTGVDLYPTGRIAVFSNSVLFQPTTPLYKQVPGTEYAWHEVSTGLQPGGDHKLVHDKFLAAVNAVYGEYRDVMERQQGTIGDRMEIVLKAPAPEARFQLDDDGMTLLIRYPVLLRRAPEIDDHVARALMAVVGGDSAAKSAIAGTPKIRAAVKG
jgi:small-conductance mechanosensitive channel